MKNEKTSKIDYGILAIAFILVILGFLILGSVSSLFSQRQFGFSGFYLLHQLIYGLFFGLILGFAAFLAGRDFLKRIALPALLLNILLMLLVFVPGLGIKAGGAARWLNLGIFSFQPAEFLKLTFIIYLSAWLTNLTALKNKKEKTSALSGTKKRQSRAISSSSHLLPFLVAAGIIIFLFFLQSDLGTLGIVLTTGALMYFSSKTPLWHTIFVALLSSIGFFSLIKFSSYRANRIAVFLNPEIDPLGIGFQLKQSLIAVGSGGIAGLGLGMSNQKFGFLPQVMSDSIFSIFAEETGFLGSFVLVVLFVAFLWRGFKIAKNTSDNFSKLFALGFSFWIVLQAFVNISSMVGIFPLTGIPLPFMSYGGTHLVAELTGLGILLAISKSRGK